MLAQTAARGNRARACLACRACTGAFPAVGGSRFSAACCVTTAPGHRPGLNSLAIPRSGDGTPTANFENRLMTSPPLPPDASTGVPAPAPPARHRPWGWIAACVLLVIAAGGLAIWAFSLQSDLDDQRAQTDQAQQQAQQASEQVDSLSGQVDEISQTVDETSDQLAQSGADARQTAQEALDGLKTKLESVKAQIEQAAASDEGSSP